MKDIVYKIKYKKYLLLAALQTLCLDLFVAHRENR